MAVIVTTKRSLRAILQQTKAPPAETSFIRNALNALEEEKSVQPEIFSKIKLFAVKRLGWR